MYCTKQTRANLHGASAGCPLLVNRSANSFSSKIVPKVFRKRIKRFPFGRHAFAIRAVSSGIASIFSGCNDIVSALLFLALVRSPQQCFAASLLDVILSV